LLYDAVFRPYIIHENIDNQQLNIPFNYDYSFYPYFNCEYHSLKIEFNPVDGDTAIKMVKDNLSLVFKQLPYDIKHKISELTYNKYMSQSQVAKETESFIDYTIDSYDGINREIDVNMINFKTYNDWVYTQDKNEVKIKMRISKINLALMFFVVNTKTMLISDSIKSITMNNSSATREYGLLIDNEKYPEITPDPRVGIVFNKNTSYSYTPFIDGAVEYDIYEYGEFTNVTVEFNKPLSDNETFHVCVVNLNVLRYTRDTSGFLYRLE
jgi:hypothetical protein